MPKINKQEKRLLYILAGVGLLALIYIFLIEPAIKLATTDQTTPQSGVQQLQKLDEIHDQYLEARKKKQRYSSLLNKRNDNIASQLEQWENSSGLAKNIEYSKRSQTNIKNKYIKTTTTIKINAAAIQNLTKFVYEIESSEKMLTITYLQIYPGIKGSKLYDALIKIDSYVKN